MATLTVYPVAGSNSPVDGYATRSSVNESFATIRAGAGTAGVTTSPTAVLAELISHSVTDEYFALYRGFFCFDTSALTAPAVISSASLSLFGTGKGDALGTPDLHIAGAALASTADVTASDFVNISRTTFGNVTYASFSTLAYNAISLNASGIAAISKTGITQFSAQLSWDLNNSFTGVWDASNISYFQGKYADTTGTTNDPMLVVTYTIPPNTLTVQATGVTDCYLQTVETTTNFNNAYLGDGQDTADSRTRVSLVKFDISSVPAGSTIIDATMTLTVRIPRTGNTRTLSCFRVKRAWVDTQATWNVYSTGNSWGTAGCGNTTTDREGSSIGTVSQPSTAIAGDLIAMTLDPAKIQEMITGGVFTNNGFFLQVDTLSNDCILYDSADNGTSGNNPKLVINYNTPTDVVKALVVAGGGGSANYSPGGAGGFLYEAFHVVTPQAYTITVGNGGASSTGSPNNASNGQNSVFDTMTAVGGGGGKWGFSGEAGVSGGSGSGGVPAAGAGGAGTGGQGSAGGTGGTGSGTTYSAGGGGGAGAVGANGGTNAGAGGAGTSNSISGAAVTYAGGGGGGSFENTAGAGGAGGGGNGGSNGTGQQDGTANTGGGAGGAGAGSGPFKAGGSGIVIMSFVTADFVALGWIGTGGTITTNGANTVHTFTSSGTFEVELAITSSVSKYMGVTQANIKKVSSVAIASAKTLMGVANT